MVLLFVIKIGKNYSMLLDGKNHEAAGQTIACIKRYLGK
jgi:hypothetical protein